MSEAPVRNHSDVIRENLDLKGKRVIDVGCGDGAIVRLLAREGAKVIGIECGEEPLTRARHAERVADERYLSGHGEALPLGDASADIVCYFNSLHHVPVPKQLDALADAGRVLKPWGLLYIQEPVAAGNFFQAVRLVEDETQVRASAKQAIAEIVRRGLFVVVREYDYVVRVVHRDFESFRDKVLLANAARRERFEANAQSLRDAFERLGRNGEDGWEFFQPCRLDLLRRLYV